MKIKTFADSQGVSIDRMNRAAIWALEQTGREKPTKGGRYGGVELTEVEKALCIQYLAEHSKGKIKEPTAKQVYDANRGKWLNKWVKAYEQSAEGRERGAILAVIGGLLCAKDRSWLDGACEGARNGDLLVELAYGASVDIGPANREGAGWTGFTRYLLDQGFESPGWDIL